MLLDDWQHLRGKGLHHFVVALLGIFREQILGPLVGANLLLGVSLVEILRVRSDQILDHQLMLGVELFRQTTLMFACCTIPFSSSVVCECASTTSASAPRPYAGRTASRRLTFP